MSFPVVTMSDVSPFDEWPAIGDTIVDVDASTNTLPNTRSNTGSTRKPLTGTTYSTTTVPSNHAKYRTFLRSEYSGLVRAEQSHLYHQYLWEESRLQKHVERILRAKPQIDSTLTCPGSSDFFNGVKMREKEMKLKRINAANDHLVGRISHLMSKPPSIEYWNNIPTMTFKSEGAYNRRAAKITRDRQNTQLLERIMGTTATKETCREHLLDEYNTRHQRLRDHLRRFPFLPDINRRNGAAKYSHSLLSLKKSVKSNNSDIGSLPSI